MKIAVLDFNVPCQDVSVDVITVDEEWMQTEMRNHLSETYDDNYWTRICEDESELTDLFLFDFCGYNPGNSYHIVSDAIKINHLTPKDFSK